MPRPLCVKINRSSFFTDFNQTWISPTYFSYISPTGSGIVSLRIDGYRATFTDSPWRRIASSTSHCAENVFICFLCPSEDKSDYFPVQHWLVERLKPYRHSVDSDSTALSVVPAPTSSSKRHVISRCFSSVYPHLLLSIGCLWTMKIMDFLKNYLHVCTAHQ